MRENLFRFLCPAYDSFRPDLQDIRKRADVVIMRVREQDVVKGLSLSVKYCLKIMYQVFLKACHAAII